MINAGWYVAHALVSELAKKDDETDSNKNEDDHSPERKVRHTSPLVWDVATHLHYATKISWQTCEGHVLGTCSSG